MKATKVFQLFGFIILAVGLLSMTACAKKTTEADTNPTASRDAATTIASNLAYDTGGTVDQMADLSTFTTTDGLENLKNKYPSNTFTITKTYDAITGIWSIHIVRERGIDGTVPYALMTRDYTLQFLNADGIFQQNYVTGADTARTVHFNVVDGYGRHETHQLTQMLTQLTAHWTVTNAHQDYITINGDYYRAAVDTLTNPHHTRVSNHTLQLAVHDVVAPRGVDSEFAGAISGSVTGHYHASITFIIGTEYNERIVDRDINIVFGSGRADIVINATTYRSSLETGELED